MEKDLRSLTAQSGCGGRIKDVVPEEKLWSFFTTSKESEIQSEIENDPVTSDDEDDDDDDTHSSSDELDYNALINLKALKSYIEDNFVCKHCIAEGGKKKGPSGVVVSMTTKGLATTVQSCCQPKRKSNASHTCRLEPAEMVTSKKRNRNGFSSYSLNQQFVLGLQYNGLGNDGAESLCGFLGMKQPWTKRTWHSLEAVVADKVIPLGYDVINANLKAEIALSPINPDGSIDLVVSFDMGWQKRSTGNSYNSPSGHAFLIGARTRKVVAMVVMAKKCSFCVSWAKTNIAAPVPNHDCTKNHEGSSKSMEPLAAVELLVMVHKQGTPVARLVGDDDSSFRANIRHSYKERMQSETDPFTAKDWPRNEKSKRKHDDKGKLPLTTPEVKEALADPSHRTKCFAKPLFLLAVKPKKSNESGLTKQDCERLKTNHGYFLKMYRNLPLPEFVAAAPAVVEHHFNNHSLCDDWCPYSPKHGVKTRKQSPASASKYRSKTKHKAMYDKVKELTNHFFTEARLRESSHPFDSQINEALNNSVAKYAPKNRNFSRTKSLLCRIAFCVGVHGTDINTFISRFPHIHINGATRLFLERRANRTKYKSEQQRRLSTKKKRSIEKKMKQKKAFEDDKKERRQGTTYRTGHNLKEDRPPAGAATRKKPKISPVEEGVESRQEEVGTFDTQCACAFDGLPQYICSHTCMFSFQRARFFWPMKCSQIFQWNPILSQRPTNFQKLTAKIPFWRYKLTKKSLNLSRWVAPNIVMKKVTKAKQTKYKPLCI